MTADEALEALFGDPLAGDAATDLLEALREAMRRREQNTVAPSSPPWPTLA